MSPTPYRIEYDYSDTPTIRKFALSNKRVRCLMGPFGSGKSSGCVVEIIRRAHNQIPGPDGIRRSRWAVVRNSYMQLRDTTIKTFHDWFPPKLFGEWRVTDHTYIFTKFPNVHLEVIFRALDRPDQVSNLLSLEVTGAWFNEAREIPRTIIEAMDSRIGRYPSKRDGGASWYGIIMDTNPPDDDSYLYKMFEKVRPKEWQIYKQPSGLSAKAENTTHLPKNYYQNLAIGKDEMYKRIYIDGQYGYLLTGKPVFISFRDNIHVASNILEPIKGLDVIVGMDFGLQPAAVIRQIMPMGQVRILDELVSDGMGIRQFCLNQLIPLLRTKYFGMSVMGFGDPAGTSRAQTDEKTCFEILHSPEIGLSNIFDASTNAITARVGAVETFLNKLTLGEPGFVLSPNCRYLRKGMNGGYHYDKDPRGNAEEYKEIPSKNFYSHVCLSGDTMVLTVSGEKKISEIVVGDMVVTPFGKRRVTASGITGISETVYETILADGTKIISTGNHEFVSNKGIVKCDTLEYNDVLIKNNSWRTLKWNIQSLLSSRARSIGFRQEITTGRKTGVKTKPVTFTGRFGKIFMDARFRPVTTFTILTTILLTTTSEIFNLFTTATMPVFILKNVSQRELLTMKRRLLWQERKQKNGINPKKDGNGTGKTGKMHGKIENIIKSTVSIAGKNWSHPFLLGRNSAGSTVRRDSDIIAGRMTLKEIALSAVRCLRQISIARSRRVPRIVGVRQLKDRRPVYNITVEKDHVFYANGILTCNCDALEYFCLYLNEKEHFDRIRKAFHAQMRKQSYRPASMEAGY